MPESRFTAVAATLLLTSLACGGDTGPNADGAVFLSLTVDDLPWTMVGPSLTLVGNQLKIGGSYQVPNSNLSYSVTIAAKPFTGNGSYALVGPYGNQAVYFIAIDSVSPGPSPSDFVADSSNPGTLEITDYRESDSTVVGSFHAQLHGVTTPGVVKNVVGSFRARATP